MKIGKIEQPKIFTSTKKPPKPVKKPEETQAKAEEQPKRNVPPRQERPQNLGRVIPPSERRAMQAKKAEEAKGDNAEKKASRKPAQNQDNDKKTVTRHVISQDIYENRGNGKRKGLPCGEYP